MSRKNVRLKGSLLMLSGHIETIFPAVFRQVKLKGFKRRRIDTPDGDFLDLDILKGATKKTVILCHGLEGNSRRPYMKGMAKILNQNGFRIISWNFRGCSEINNTRIFYHSGATYDLSTVVKFALEDNPDEIHLVGFSLGGNLILKYLGEGLFSEVKNINKSVAISVPLDLKDCSNNMHKLKNKLYHDRFLSNLKAKIRKKASFGFDYDLVKLKTIKTLYEIDEHFTAPIHGFEGAEDYYAKCSSINYLEEVKTQTLILNARNDSFFNLPSDDFLSGHPTITFELTNRGGHCGFPSTYGTGFFEAEKRVLKFLIET